ncbi:MAG TPA: FxLYD domain-containing protein [Verrucomicrobiae bacterium]|jgi:hypothetical protein|nr:FxLYD domain-containing protein [Verrucomicrobiae bacterium]
MEEAVHLKCACSNCGEVIEYLPKAAGQVVQCPKCKVRSNLPVPSAAEPDELPPKPPPTCPVCGSFLDLEDLTCPECGRRRRIKVLALGVGSAVGLLAVSAAALMALNRPAKKPPVAPFPNPPAAHMVLAQPAVHTPKSANDLRVGQFYLQQQRGNPMVLAVGEIQNISQNAHFHVKVFMDLLDAKGAKIGTVSDVNNLIRPGDRWQPLVKMTDSRVANVRFAGLKEDQ